MSCVGDTCGTGGGNIPKPGDPNNNGVLSATPAFGGIDINWTFPTTNPFAVAYTTIYRSLSNDFNAAILLAPQVGGGFYYDPVDPGIEYFYWITFVSINGTVGEVIGPVSAVARSAIEKIIEELTGKIDSGVLAGGLKTEIARIGDINSDLLKEARDRALADAGLSAGVGQVQDIADLAITAVVTETNERKAADAAMVESINLLYAQASGATAAIQEEARVRAEKDLALAQQITTVQSTLDGEIAQVQTTMETKITAVDGKVTSIGALYTAKVNVNGLIGGFGVYNDGTTVEAGFDVDTFWVGRTSANKRKPFIIVGQETFIDEAVINKLTFSKLRAEDGSVIVENGKLKAAYIDADNITARKIDVSSGVAGQPRMTMVNNVQKIYDINSAGAEVVVVQIGNLDV